MSTLYPYQVLPDLTPVEYAALKADIAQRGVLVPVEVDETGAILDGHHRARAWQELRAEGIALPDFPRIVRPGMTEEQKRNHARILNVLRRQLSREQRDEIMRAMRGDGATYQEIAQAVGVSYGTAHSAAADVIVKTDIENARGQVRPAAYARREFAAELPAWATQEDEPEPEPEQTPNGKPHVAHNSGNNEWYTPGEYMDAVHEVMGGIDLDPCSTEEANHIVQATAFYTAEDDGLRQPWAGRVWMNPPYSSDLIGKFCAKFAAGVSYGQITEGIVLVNNATETQWFMDLVQVCQVVVFPRGRVRFWQPGGSIGAPLQGQAFFYAGKQQDWFVEVFSGFGWFARI